jgi:hypothetical protein
MNAAYAGEQHEQHVVPNPKCTVIQLPDPDSELLPGWSSSLGAAYVRKRRRLGGRRGSASETMRLAFVRNAGVCAYFNAC